MSEEEFQEVGKFLALGFLQGGEDLLLDAIDDLVELARTAVGLSALASIAAIVTRGQLHSHTVATALTNGYVAGLTAGAAIFTLGAGVALICINANISAEEISGH